MKVKVLHLHQRKYKKRQDYNFVYRSQLNELKSWLEDIEEKDKIDNGKRYSFDEIKNDIKK